MISDVQVLGQPAKRIVAPDGAMATVLLHGGQIVSWVPAGDQERLYLSPIAVAGPGQAVRGGIPVIFPQFEQRGPLPRHGLARNRGWQWVEGAVRGDAAFCVLRLTDDEASRAIWPHAFELELTLSLSGLRLDVELAVSNTGHTAFEFTAALHSYLRIGDLARAKLHGLYGVRYQDMVHGGSHLQELDPLGFAAEIDRLYQDLRGPLSLATAMGRMAIEFEGFPDAVLWNPGPAKAAALADLPDGDWQRFLCIEAALVGAPMRLSPGQDWVGRQGFDA